MRSLFLALVISTPLWCSCSSGEKQAAQLLDTARFEEKQHNLEHATQLYEEIIKKHSSTAAARDAALRLEELRRPKAP